MHGETVKSCSLILMSVQFPLTRVQQHLLHSTSLYRPQCMHLAAHSDFQEDTTSWKRSVSRTHSMVLDLFTVYMINMKSTTEQVKFCRSSNFLYNFKMSVCHVYHKYGIKVFKLSVLVCLQNQTSGLFSNRQLDLCVLIPKYNTVKM
jgi:hypothetical protein